MDPVGGDVSFHERSGDRAIELPCGRCVGCRLDRALSWSVRCQHEAQLYRDNSFVTLTYDDQHLPVDRSLEYPHVQKFLKRLRWHAQLRRVRFFCAGEYGEQTERPHYHLLLFNWDFADKSRIGKALFRSALLEDLWPYGQSSCGSVTPASAAYVSRYSLKKVYGQRATDHYVDPSTGVFRRPEFCTMSRRPGLGADWFERFSRDVLPCDYVIVEGRKVRVPRFYNERYEARDPLRYEEVENQRLDKVQARALSERSAERRAVAESVREFNVNFFHERSACL